MKKFIVFVLFAVSAWYGWHHYKALLHPEPRHEAVIRNATRENLVRVRLTVGEHTYVKEELPKDQSVTFPFTVQSDSNFDLNWEFETNVVVGHWTGGLVTKGPMVSRHILTIREGGGVILESQGLPAR